MHSNVKYGIFLPNRNCDLVIIFIAKRISTVAVTENLKSQILKELELKKRKRNTHDFLFLNIYSFRFSKQIFCYLREIILTLCEFSSLLVFKYI